MSEISSDNLDQIGQRIAELAEQLKNESPDMRVQALKDLGRIQDERIIDTVMQALNDPESEVKLLAIRYLGRRREQKALAKIPELLNDKTKEIKIRAIWLLGKIGNLANTNLLYPLLENEDAELKLAAAEALNQIVFEQTNKTIKEIVVNPVTKNTERLKAIEKLINRNKKAFVLEPLIELLHDPDEDMRRDAALRFGDLDERLASLALIQALKNEFSSKVRWAIVGSLGDIGNRIAFDTLVALLNDDDENIVHNAIRGLGDIKDRRALPYLLPLLQHENAEIRYKAACAVDEYGDERAIEPLIDLLQDEDLDVFAADALRVIGAVNVIEPIIETLKSGHASEQAFVRARVAIILGEIGGERAFEVLISLLQDQDSIVKSEAAEALGELGNPLAVEPLLKILQDENENAGVHYWVIKALVQIGDPEVIPILEQYTVKDTGQLFDGLLIRDVARQAINTLKHRQTYNY